MKIDGNYNLTLDTPVGTQDGSLTLKADGSSLSGTLTNARGSSTFAGGTITGGAVEFDTKIPTPLGRLKAHVTGTVDGDHFSGEAKLPLGSARIEGDRVSQTRKEATS
jgi:hypothetical protein